MKKSDIKELVKTATENVNVINAYFRYDENYYNLIPLMSNDKLFLAINEDDFIFDGYGIFRFKDLTKVKIKNDKCDKILKNEGLIPTISMPNIDIDNWESVFRALDKTGKNIIIEKQSYNDNYKDDEFIIGRIQRVYKNFAYVWNFDADGIWDESPTKIPYTEITNIIFDSRYVTIFSKYIEEPPFNR